MTENSWAAAARVRPGVRPRVRLSAGYAIVFPMTALATSGWEVFTLFVIPIGGGIPAGVVLARSRGIPWPGMMALYFLSDVLLAFVFEPIMWLVISWGKRSAKVTRFLDALKESVKRTSPQVGHALGPLSFIAVAFGVDPMTGRAVAKAAGHGFFSGWAIAIAGDMLYFSVLMVSTLWLNNVLGDGTWTTVIMLVLMLVVPGIIRRLRAGRLAEGRGK